MDVALAVGILLLQGTAIYEVGTSSGWVDALILLVVCAALDALVVYFWSGNWDDPNG